jgi:hypothetical protein
MKKVVGTRSLSSGAHSRDPLALPTLQTPMSHQAVAVATSSSPRLRGSTPQAHTATI